LAGRLKDLYLIILIAHLISAVVAVVSVVIYLVNLVGFSINRDNVYTFSYWTGFLFLDIFMGHTFNFILLGCCSRQDIGPLASFVESLASFG